jgi:hypothetical protein
VNWISEPVLPDLLQLGTQDLSDWWQTEFQITTMSRLLLVNIDEDVKAWRKWLDAYGSEWSSAGFAPEQGKNSNSAEASDVTAQAETCAMHSTNRTSLQSQSTSSGAQLGHSGGEGLRFAKDFPQPSAGSADKDRRVVAWFSAGNSVRDLANTVFVVIVDYSRPYFGTAQQCTDIKVS